MDAINNPQFLSKLSRLVDAAKADAQILHDPKLGFFKSYLEELGASIPERKEKPAVAPDVGEESDTEEVHIHTESKPAAKPEEMEETEEEEEQEEKEPEVQGDVLDESEHPFGDDDAEVSEEVQDKAAELGREGDHLKAEGKYAEAIAKYNEAIKLESSARMVAARSLCFLALNKPNACIFDCDHALKTNPNSTRAFTARGQAYALLHKWEEAYKDLTKAQACDYNADTAAKLKDIEVKFHEKQAKDKERAARQKARQAQKNAKQSKARTSSQNSEDDMPNFGGMPDFGAGMGGMPGGMPQMPPGFLEALMSDPELMAAIQEPGMMEKLQELMSNPSKRENLTDPKLQSLMAKMAGLFGKGGKK